MLTTPGIAFSGVAAAPLRILANVEMTIQRGISFAVPLFVEVRHRA
jgi:hypothetical protein